MSSVAATPITPPDEHLVAAREALEPFYEKLQLQMESTVLTAAVEVGSDSVTPCPFLDGPCSSS